MNSSPSETPAPGLTIVGGILAAFCVLICAAVVAATAFVGIPIPWTNFVLHSVMIALIAGGAAGIAVFSVVAFFLKLLGIRVVKDAPSAP